MDPGDFQNYVCYICKSYFRRSIWRAHVGIKGVTRIVQQLNTLTLYLWYAV